MSEVSVKRVEVSGDLVTTEQVTDYKGLVFTPDSIDWVAWRWEDNPVACRVVLYGDVANGEKGHRTNVTLRADDKLPAWVPEPPISWEQMRGMIADSEAGAPMNSSPRSPNPTQSPARPRTCGKSTGGR